MEYLQEHQLDIMLILSGMCGMMTIFSQALRPLGKKRRFALTLMDLGAMLLLVADRYAYIFRGDASQLGYYMVRISNYLVFALTLVIVYAFNEYLADMLIAGGILPQVPRRLRFVRIIVWIGEALILLSQFTGFYYTFDASNHYQRADGFLLSYAVPLCASVVQLSLVVQHYKSLHKRIRIPLLLLAIALFAACVVQFFTYGISLTNITLAVLVAVLHFFSLIDMGEMVRQAHEREITHLKEEQNQMRHMLYQTASALAEAIDAKDEYTHGHSRRVAEYSQMIAELAGMDDKACMDIYITALLHDVGKIGIPDGIINKNGRLTDEEFAMIRNHPVIGRDILRKIREIPFLSIGAHYHHERYDGKGYPEGLRGEEIPEIARIIAVADSYDAMTSRRSYRDSLPQDVVREEISKGSGTQFDPKYASIMIGLIDKDTEYRLRQQPEDED